MTLTHVSSGQLVVSATLGAGDIQFVLSGGRTVSTMVGSGAEQVVSAGGSAAFTTVSKGGTEIVNGGVLVSATIDSGGTELVQAGALTSFTTVAAGAFEYVSNGANVLSSLVMGAELVSSGGTAQATTNSGTQTVLSGGTANVTLNTGIQIVSAGGVVSQTINDGQQYVSSGGLAVATRDLGDQYVYSGGIAVSTTVSSGATQFISGGTASSTLVGSDGFVIIQGGTLVDATVQAVGEVDLFAGVTTGTVLSGLESLVGKKGTPLAERSLVVSGGVLYLGQGAQATETLVDSGGLAFVDQGGSAFHTVISTGGLLEIQGATGSTGLHALGGVASDTFILNGGTLMLLGSDPLTNPVVDLPDVHLAQGGVIDLATLQFTSAETANFDSATDLLTITGGATTTEIQFAGGYRNEFFHLADDGTGGTDITVDGTPCYCRGTRILTDAGEVAVEHLAIGDRLVTLSGTARPLLWIGRRSYSGRFAAGNRDVLPVLFRAGSLGQGLPRRDLSVSPLHAMYLDGVLIPAQCLVNGRNIVQAQSMDQVAYFHLELDRHDVILAEGAPSESYVEDDNRGMFHNAAEYASIYPPTPRAAAIYCAPRIQDGPVLEQVRTRLAGASQPAAPALGPVRGWLDRVERGRIVGWAQDDSGTPVRLRILDNGATIAEIVADADRPDVQAAKGGAPACGFAYQIAGGLAPDRRHLIQVQRAADGADLPCSPHWIELQPIAPPAQAQPAQGQPGLRGFLDRVDRDRVQGWAHAGADPVAVQILDNGILIGRVLANRWRADVADAGVGEGRHAFDFAFPTPLSPAIRHTIEARRETDGAALPGSPLAIAAADSFDPALEQTIAQAVAALGGHDWDRVLNFMLTQAERLKQQGADAAAQRSGRDRWAIARRSGMAGTDPGLRALVIDAELPTPDRDAGSQAVLSHMRSLQRLGYAVSFAAAEQIGATSDLLAAEGIALCAAPLYASVEEVLRRQAGCFDLVYLHRAEIAGAYMGLARRWMGRARILYSVADLHHLRLARQAEIEQRPELLAASRRMRLAECTAAWSADAVLTHSAEEAAVLRAAVPQAQVHVAPWDVPARPAAVPFARRHGLAFIANYAHAPNVDAARYLVEQVMPLVWAQAPRLQCRLVGAAMPAIVRSLAGPGVIIDGYVPDLASTYAAVRLTVAPLRYGAGIKGKVLNSLAAGVPCAMTPIAAEALGLPGNMVGADAASLAALILRLHGSAAANRAGAIAGRRLLASEYSNDRVDAALTAAIGIAHLPAAAIG